MNRDRKRRQELEKLDKVDLIEGYMLLEKRLATLEAQMDAFKRAIRDQARQDRP